jgi:DNA-binding MarR family transcriptional regulator
MAPRPPPGALLHELFTRLDGSRGGRAIEVMHEAGLTLPQIVVLHALTGGERAVGALADHLSLSMSATSTLVQRLVEAGLVSRTENPDDRREKQVALTRPGTVLIERIASERSRALARGLDALPAALRDELLDVLGRALDHLRTQARP